MISLRNNSQFTGNSKHKETYKIKPHKRNHENPDQLVEKSQTVFGS